MIASPESLLIGSSGSLNTSALANKLIKHDNFSIKSYAVAIN